MLMIQQSDKNKTKHPRNGLFFRTTWMSWYQKDKTSQDLNKTRDDGVFRWQWRQLAICENMHLAPDR